MLFVKKGYSLYFHSIIITMIWLIYKAITYIFHKFSIYMGANGTDFIQGEENQWEPQRISTSMLFSLIFLTTWNEKRFINKILNNYYILWYSISIKLGITVILFLPAEFLHNWQPSVWDYQIFEVLERTLLAAEKTQTWAEELRRRKSTPEYLLRL